MKPASVTTHMKASQYYFLVVLFKELYMVVLTLKSMKETLQFDYPKPNAQLW